MKKSFMNNIKNFVDSNVRQRIDRAANTNNDFFGDDLLLVERQFEDIRYICIEAEKKISSLLQSSNNPTPLRTYTQNVQASITNLTVPTNSNLKPSDSFDNVQYFNRTKASASTPYSSKSEQPHAGNNHSAQLQQAKEAELHEDMRRHKKLPIIGFLKFITKSCHKLKPDSLLATTLTHCSLMQTQMTHLYLIYEQTIESECLKPLRQILETDVPNVVKLRKLFIKSHNDLESVRAKFNGASQKQHQLQTTLSTGTSYTIAQTTLQQANTNKLDQLRKELDDAASRFEQAKDIYAAELYAFVCREAELVDFFVKFYQYQAEYQQQLGSIFKKSMPAINKMIETSPRKIVFGAPLDENLRCTGRTISIVIELCVHLLYSNGLNDEGLFRISGSMIKVKKLKNAINAWFVSLGNNDYLDTVCQDQQGCDTTAEAVYELFKDIVGLRSDPRFFTAEDSRNEAILSNESTSGQAATLVKKHLVFDVHAIAGLLKLYLRELPEPLLTYDLYQPWIDAAVAFMDDDNFAAIEQVAQRLPKVNYNNLRHLIRFLHLLTCHSKSNKMTASNLAITMAPSLIWAQHNNANQQPSTDDHHPTELQIDDIQALNMQMSSMGKSASMHALVVENLITHAEKLFPGHLQFAMANLNHDSINIDRSIISQSRNTKSTSPTGFSTASSSSFSSASVASHASPRSKGKHSRKGGSMDGLLSCIQDSAGLDRSTLDGSALNVSIPVKKADETKGQIVQPPPVPPTPAARSHMKQSSDTIFSNKEAASIPLQSSLRRQQPLDKKLDIPSDRLSKRLAIKSDEPSTSGPQASGAMSGGARCSPSPLLIKNTNRPTVPPPCRPRAEAARQLGCKSVEVPSFSGMTDSSSAFVQNDTNQNIPSADLNRPNSAANNRAKNDDNSSALSVSPAVSMDSISVGDSSFDDESPSLENSSWTECDLDQVQAGPSAVPTSHEIPDVIQSNVTGNSGMSKNLHVSKDEPEPAEAPVKPPRCLSPRAVQSTPL